MAPIALDALGVPGRYGFARADVHCRASAMMSGNSAAELARRLQLFDFLMIGLVIFIWALALTVTIGCVIVWLMKGPAYVADGFEVSHSDNPRS